MPTQLKQISLYDNNSIFNSMSTLSQASQVAPVVKNLPVIAGRRKRRRFDPWSGRSPGGGHGNPLQYSCLENPMDRGAWQDTVHRFTKSQTRLKRLTMHVHLKMVKMEKFILRVFHSFSKRTWSIQTNVLTVITWIGVGPWGSIKRKIIHFLLVSILSQLLQF